MFDGDPPDFPTTDELRAYFEDKLDRKEFKLISTPGRNWTTHYTVKVPWSLHYYLDEETSADPVKRRLVQAHFEVLFKEMRRALKIALMESMTAMSFKRDNQEYSMYWFEGEQDFDHELWGLVRSYLLGKRWAFLPDEEQFNEFREKKLKGEPASTTCVVLQLCYSFTSQVVSGTKEPGVLYCEAFAGRTGQPGKSIDIVYAKQPGLLAPMASTG